MDQIDILIRAWREDVSRTEEDREAFTRLIAAVEARATERAKFQALRSE